jgi:hypothetical protein
MQCMVCSKSGSSFHDPIAQFGLSAKFIGNSNTLQSTHSPVFFKIGVHIFSLTTSSLINTKQDRFCMQSGNL